MVLNMRIVIKLSIHFILVWLLDKKIEMESHSIFLSQTTETYVNIIKQVWKQNRKTLIRPLFYLVFAQPWVKFLDCDCRQAEVVLVDNLSVVCHQASASEVSSGPDNDKDC